MFPLRPLLCLVLLFATGAAQARTCLVLSGGGARGMAHIGVLKVLERERVPVDCIVGTSMGAVIGSLYASGLDAGEVEAAMAAIDWPTVLRDESARVDRPLRARQQDRTFLVGAAIGYRDGRFGIPRALVRGQRFSVLLRGLLLPSAGAEDFDALATPFRAVATDLETGIMQVLADGDLPSAVRASMAVPGALPPVERNGRLLIDGGAVSNLPVGVARDWGATRIIAVDISAPLRGREDLQSPVTITDQMVTVMMRRQTEAEIAALRHDDLLITPRLGDIGSLDFARAQRDAVAPGEAAAEAVRERLAAFALEPTAYAAWQRRRGAAIRALAAPVKVEFEGASSVARRAVLQTYLHEHPDEAFDREMLEADIARLYARGEFDQVDYRFEGPNEAPTLHVSVREREWGNGSLRFGLRLEDDFDGSSNFDFGSRLRATEINSHGAEWVADLQIGKTTRLGYEWLQPLDALRQWWVMPHVAYSARNQPLFFGSQRAIELRRQSLEIGFDAGRWLDDWGAFSAGVFRRTSRYQSRTSALEIPSQQQPTFGLRLDYLLDTQDDAQFPRDGHYLQASLRQHLRSLGGDYDTLIGEWRSSHAFAIADDDRLLLQSRLQYAKGDELPADEFGFLGGFLDLSGFSEDARIGRHLALLQAIYYRSLTTVFDRYRVFLGGSLETGNTWENEREISLDSMLWGGSVFVAAESPLGALYFGYGRAEAGEDSLYLFVGRPY
jgi:NTE family protein